MTQSAIKNDKAYYIKTIIIFAVIFGFRFIPPVGDITPYGMSVIGVFIGMILGWSWDPKCMTWPSLLGLIALGFSGENKLTPLMVQSIGSINIFLMIVVMLIIGAVTAASIDNYLIVKIMSINWAQGRPWVITFLLIVGPFILSVFLINYTVILFLLPIYAKIFQKVGYATGDKYVLNVYIGMILACISAAMIFPFLPLAVNNSALVLAYTGTTWGNVDYMLTVSIWAIAVAVFYVFYMRLIGCDASKIVNIDLSLFESNNKSLTKYQVSVFGFLVVFIIGSLIVSFGSLMQNPIGIFFSKLSIYGWATFVAIMMMIVKVDGQRLLNLTTAARGVN